MRRSLLVLATLACLAPAAPTAQRQLTLVLTAAKADGTELSGLTADDLRITEDGAECRILKIEESAQRRLKLQVLVDNGAGMGSSHGIVRDEMRAFMKALPDGLEVTLVTTSPRPRVRVPATANREDLLAGVEQLSRDSGGGQFTESIAQAAERVARDTTPVPVILSVATPSDSNELGDRDIQQMRERLRDGGATVHVIMYADVQAQVRGERQIALGRLLTQETGGRFELLQSISGLKPLLTGFAERVRADAGSGGGARRQFRVTIERPEGRSGDLGRMQLATTGLTILSTTFE